MAGWRGTIRGISLRITDHTPVGSLLYGDSYMRFIRLHRAPLVVVSALLISPVVVCSARTTTAPVAPAHKHYDDPNDVPAPVPGAPLAPRLHHLGVHSFFFQAEDGIRDGTVTGVQTCALPI